MAEVVLDAVASTEAKRIAPSFCAVAATEPLLALHWDNVEFPRNERQHILLRQVSSVVLGVSDILRDLLRRLCPLPV